MNSAIKLSIVFLNFNKLNETQFTSEALKKLCHTRDDIEIIAVDNGSVDGTADYLKSQSHIQSILLPDNGGIAGYSAGFNQAKGQYILVLDDDSCPTSLTTIDAALAKLDQQENIGIIAAHIETPEGEPQWSWHLPKSDTFCPSPFFIGCGFIIRHDLFKKIGWYPENFFLYQNEIDVSFQVRLQGYDIFYDPNFIVIHRGKPSIRPNWRRIFYPTRNTLWLLRRYYPQPLASYLIFSRIIIGLLRATQFGELTSYFKALKAGLFSPIKKNPLPTTIQIQSQVFFQQNNIFNLLINTLLKK